MWTTGCAPPSRAPDDMDIEVMASEVTYVDDDLMMCDADTPEELVTKTASMLQLVVDTFTECGLKCNLAPGKTEVSIQLVGKGARKAKAKLFDASDGRHFLTTTDGKHRALIYFRLGTEAAEGAEVAAAHERFDRPREGPGVDMVCCTCAVALSAPESRADTTGRAAGEAA